MTLHPSVTRPARRALPTASTTVAALFAAQTGIQLVVPPQSQPLRSPGDYAIELSFLAGLLAVTVATVLLHRWHTATPRWSRFGTTASLVTALGTGLLTITVAATAVAGRNVLGVLFLVGLALWVLGSILLAVAAYRARVLPRPVAVLVGAAVPLATLIDAPAGPVVVAVLWAAIAWCSRR